VTGSAQTAAAESRLMPSIVCARVSPQSRKSAHPPASPPVCRSHRVFIFLRLLFSLPRPLPLPRTHTLFPLGSACKRQSDRRADGSCIIIKFRVRARPRAPHPRGDETTHTHTHVLAEMYIIILFCCTYSSNINTILLLLLSQCVHAQRAPMGVFGQISKTETCLKYNVYMTCVI